MKSTLFSLVTEGLQYLLIILLAACVYVVLEVSVQAILLYHHTHQSEKVHDYRQILHLARNSVRNMIAIHMGKGPEDLEPVNEYNKDD